MEHDMKSIRAELARIDDALTRIEADLRSILGEEHTPTEDAAPAVAAVPEYADPGRAERVSRYLEQLAGTPISYSRLVNYIAGRNKDKTRTAMRWLEGEGYVTVTPGPRNSRMYTSRRPFRAPSAPA